MVIVLSNSLDALLASVQKQLQSRTPNTNAADPNRPIDKNSVTKSNALSRSYYRFTLHEKRMMEAIISRLHPLRADNELQDIELTASQYAKTYNVPLNHAYDDLKKSATGLMRCIIKTRNEDGKGYTESTLMLEATYRQSEGRVLCTINPRIVRHLVGLKNKFNSYSLSKTVNFTSTYTWRFYELLVSWARPKKETRGIFCGWFNVKIDELRLMLGVPESYNMTRLQVRVFDVVIEELKDKASIQLRINKKKTGRKFTDLEIRFIEDTQLSLSFNAEEESPDQGEENPPEFDEVPPQFDEEPPAYTDEDIPFDTLR